MTTDEQLTEIDATVEALAGSLYESLMEASADQWRRWEFLTDHAKERYRAEAARIITTALAPAIAAQALREAAEDIEMALDHNPEKVRQADVIHYLRRRADRVGASPGANDGE